MNQSGYKMEDLSTVEPINNIKTRKITICNIYTQKTKSGNVVAQVRKQKENIEIALQKCRKEINK
jgi:hypothetical protein